ncbi:diguanylate cyclase [Micromonospora sp. CPCC 206060]|uniref:diguanylate cyclase n=1 Tax=Micromonospora sp. CPCC 206060 TaxID=3122406 RepID=UPI002FF1964E
MTLRGRLTTAFLAVVLGPVLLGAFFVGSTMAAVAHQRSVERLNLAASAARTSVGALCQQLRATVDVLAMTPEAATRAGAASQLVTRGVASAVRITDTAGQTTFVTPEAPPAPWTDCTGRTPPGIPARVLAARVELRDVSGADLGAVIAAQLLDTAFVARLAAVTGTAVTLLDDRSVPAAVTHTTEATTTRDAVLAAASRIAGDTVAETADGRYVRRVGPSPGQPLPLVLSVPAEHPQGLYAVLVGAVVLAGLLAVLTAWRLARITTRPLAELAHAVDRVAHGDLAARVPVRTRDEVGRLASTFNRMTRETESYVRALTTSRDQLRGHLAVLGDTLASTHDLPRILRVILRSAMTATGARAGLVLLVDPVGGALVGQCAEGLDGRWPVPVGHGPHPGPVDPRSLRVPLGSGVLGAVAATGEPQRGRPGSTGTPGSTGEPRCDTYIAVPFAAPGPTGAEPPLVIVGNGARAVAGNGARTADGNGARMAGEGSRMAGESARVAGETGRAGTGSGPALGVLVLYDRLGGDDFDDADLDTLRTFAGHAAVAVENVRVHEEVQRLSLTDPLTGLWNYRYLKESMRREVERANRFGRMLSVLALDLDRFKEVNDTHGHAAGDAVLAEFAGRLRAEIREVDLAFRSGGEEFVVLLPETDARGATIVAERLGAAIRATPVTVHPHPGTPVGPGPVEVAIAVTVSIGIAVFPDHAATGQQVLDAADDALYAAKAGGRDTYRLATALPVPPTGDAPVPAAAGTPDDGRPVADGRAGASPGGASCGPQPPRQSRGR